MVTTRNNNIDYLKFLLAGLVVCLHIPLKFGGIWMWLEPITRVAVPGFFIISGYFMYSPDRTKMNDRLWRGLRRIAWILIWSSAVYFLWLFQSNLRNGEWHFAVNCSWVSLLVFNINPFGSHLWYISAYLYVLVVALILNTLVGWRILKPFIPILLAANLLFGVYAMPILGFSLPMRYTRNFLLCGIPFFVLGIWLGEKAPMIKRYFSQSHRYRLLVLGTSACVVLAVIEKYVIRTYSGVAMDLVLLTGDIYLFTIVLSLLLFLTFICSPSLAPSLLSDIGQKDSLYIYVFHVMVMFILGKIMMSIPALSSIYVEFTPIFVLLATIIAIRFVRYIYRRVTSLYMIA